MHDLGGVAGLVPVLDSKATPGDISAAIAAHVALPDPHAQYLTEAEADLLYEPLGGGGAFLEKANNLSDLTSVPAARANLGLGTAAVEDVSAFQEPLVSGTNIKTINGSSILGAGNLAVGGGASASAATITVPAPGRFEHYQTITDAAVSPTSVINIWLGATVNADENCPEMLDLVTLSAIPGAGNFEVTAAFSARTSGPIKLNYTVS